jgi:transposase
MTVNYTDGFRANMVRRLTGPEAISALVLSREVGVAQTTLSRWLAQASTLSDMNAKQGGAPEPKSTRQWTVEEKLALVAEAANVAPAELGAFLRQKGLRSTELDAWREQIRDALDARRKPGVEGRRIKELERDLERADKKLKVAEALLDLQKKVRAIWGDGDEPTPPKSAP